MTDLLVGVVDVYVIRPYRAEWLVLALKRSPDTRGPRWGGTVHGRVDPLGRPEEGAGRQDGLPGLLHRKHARAAFLRKVGRGVAISRLAQAEAQQVSVMAGQHGPVTAMKRRNPSSMC